MTTAQKDASRNISRQLNFWNRLHQIQFSCSNCSQSINKKLILIEQYVASKSEAFHQKLIKAVTTGISTCRRMSFVTSTMWLGI